MDERFRVAYQILFDNYQISNELPVDRGGLGTPPISALLRSIINNVDSELERDGKHLRADSKFFLLVNFYSMVYTPLSIADQLDSFANVPSQLFVENVAIQDILAAISADVREIAQSAAGQEPDAEISGHALINTIGARWRDLRTTQFRLWGDK